ncbi:response regulator transcription factor [Oribacterium sp. WCC10]|uniref:response regulator transcription factor n=1 Tax=Oribacterium sp. WCC10 TaxID=1855343 RepID=UPI0008E9C496|nr:response regulator transcription factor [Oribacterium sp. WCC10]SFG53269.1 DNA-binding response regulator, OmpR family, contains REC and winged-helix (wHTH) domain [Oribacterium sp. WCC10]
MANENILVVDDEAAIRLAMRVALKREGMRVTEAPDGKEAIELLGDQKFSLVILDVMMENVGGYEVLRHMRSNDDMTPVLMLSGKSDEADQMMGLDFGADSYLTKPFHTALLIQNVKALIRRTQVYAHVDTTKLKCGHFSVDTVKMECLKDGEPLDFTGRETSLFRFLMEHPGEVFTKEQLYRQIWDDSGAVVDENTVTVYVKRIRSKIEKDPKNPVYLKTVRGVGYRFDQTEM